MVYPALHEHAVVEAEEDDCLTRSATSPETKERKILDTTALRETRAAGQVRFTGTYRRLVKGKNINEKTLLATDYLNHFNEVIMLIGMIPSMPECLEDAKAWQPKSYQAHFRESVFSDKELAIEAYEHAPPEYRAPFDAVVERLNAAVDIGISEIEKVPSGNPMVLDALCQSVGADLQSLVDRASAIINGYADSLDRAEIDQLMGEGQDQTALV